MARRTSALSRKRLSQPEADRILNSRYRIVQEYTCAVRSPHPHYTIYQAEDLYLPGHPPCLIKHLRLGSTTQDDPLVQAAQQEARALVACTHPKTPRLLAFWQQDSDCFLVQTCPSGSLLIDEFTAGEAWSGQQTIQFLQDSLHLLEFVHDQRILHRHLTPWDLVRQADGAIALTGLGHLESHLPQHFPGMNYLSPEQSRGKLWESSNLYGLGMICIHALSGCAPDTLESDPETGNLIWTAQEPVTPALVAFVNQLSTYYFKERISSCCDALKALQPLLDNRPQVPSLLSSPVQPTQPLAVSFPLFSEIEAATHSEPSPPKFRSPIAADVQPKSADHNQFAARTGKAAIAGVSIAGAMTLGIQHLQTPITPELGLSQITETASASLDILNPVAASDMTTAHLPVPAPPPPRAMPTMSRSTPRQVNPVPVQEVSLTPDPPDQSPLLISDEPESTAVEPSPQTPEVSAQPPHASADSTFTVESSPLYRNVMAILHGPPATVIRTLRQLAQQYEGQGNYNAAIFFYTHVIEQQQLLYGEVHEEVALSQLELGRLYRESNQFAEAQATYEASLAMWRSLYGEDHPMILASLEILATLQDDLLPPSPPEMEVASLSLKADEAVNLPTQDDTKPSTPSAEASSTELSFPDATTTQPDVQSDIQPEGDSQKEPSTSLTEYQSSTLNSHLSESNPSESNPSEDLHSEDLDNDLPDVLLDDAPDMPADSV